MDRQRTNQPQPRGAPAPRVSSGKSRQKQDSLSVTELENIHVRLPDGIADTGRYVVAILRTTGKMEVGMIKGQLPNIEPLNDIVQVERALRVIRGEETFAKKEEKAEIAQTAALRLNVAANEVPQNFKAEINMAANQLRILEANGAIASRMSEGKDAHRIARDVLLETVKRGRTIFDEYIASLVPGKKTFKELCAKHKVPYWIFNRMISTGIDVNIRSLDTVLFPTGGIKGLRMTLEEIRTVDETYEPLLKNSNIFRIISSDPNFLGVITTESLDTEKAKKEIEGFTFAIIPIGEWSNYAKKGIGAPPRIEPQKVVRPLEILQRAVWNLFLVAVPSNAVVLMGSLYKVQIDSQLVEPRAQMIANLNGDRVLALINDPSSIVKVMDRIDPETESESRGDLLKILSSTKIGIAPPVKGEYKLVESRLFAKRTEVEAKKIAQTMSGPEFGNLKAKPRKTRKTQAKVGLTKTGSELLLLAKSTQGFSNMHQDLVEYLTSFRSTDFADMAARQMLAHISKVRALRAESKGQIALELYSERIKEAILTVQAERRARPELVEESFGIEPGEEDNPIEVSYDPFN